MKTVSLLASTSLLGLAASAGVLAADAMPAGADDPVDEIIVTGTRFEMPLDQIGRAVSVLTEEQIELRQQRFVSDALRVLPGVQITQTGAVGSTTSVSLRGLPSNQTLVVQDGIVLNNPAQFGTSFNFANFDTNDVERLEVIRGAQSTLWGSDAIGGVINIVTKSGADGVAGSGFFEGGSFGTFRGGANVRGGNDIVSGRVSLSGVRVRGFSSADEANGNTEDDGYENYTVSAKGLYKPLDNLSFQTVLRYQDSQNEYDGFVNGVVTDADEVANTEELTVGAFATYTMFDDRLSHRASVTYVQTDRLFFSDAGISFDNSGSRLSYEYQGKGRPIDQVEVIYGMEYEEQESQTKVGFGGDQAIDTWSGYGLVHLRPLEGVSLTAGVRHDDADAFGAETTFSGSGRIEIPYIGGALRGSYSEGFRGPSVGELGFNPDLRAEYSNSWDIGLERAFLDQRVRLGVTYFDQKIDDLISFDLNAFTYRNVQRFETSGVEVSGDFRFTSKLSMNAAYTYLDAFNATTTIAANNQPDHRFNAEIAYRPINKLTLSTGIWFNGRENEDGTQPLDSFTVVSLRAEYALTDYMDVTVRIENLTDADYQDNFGYGTAPISAYGGLRVRF
ncbi:hypothetical protein CCR85_04290 [Rhodothalassium salexigens]|uniref:TonB-dependent receptor plug domain-containing protein n=1 Tax=Rhodothalassium salexigens TaxID=1086 RepID=UPI0019117317|nr:TonB-dependent receptor [Rhodothalassium salexigens]MBK5910711.1 hypothetical protein [Rhodothalassium salexigens]